MNWIDKVEFQVDSIVETFKDAMDATKADYKKAVDETNLGKWYLGRHVQFGVEFLDFNENVWLHSGSIIGALFMLGITYQAVGVVNPRDHDFDTMEQQLRIAGSYGADAPGLKSIISVINLVHHWSAFFVDVHARRCFLFDPMHLASNASTLKTAVRTVVEKIRHLTDQLQYEVVSGCEQKDSSSFGLWCLVVLGLLLFGADTTNWSDFWSDSLYDVVGYLRMRYLHKIVSLQDHLVTFGDGEYEDE